MSTARDALDILYVCHRFPYPPKRGGKIRPFNMIAHLHSRGHRVTVGSLVRSEQERLDGEGLAAHCKEVLVGRVRSLPQLVRMWARLPTPVPSSMGYFYSPELARRIRNAAASSRFDLVFVHCSSVAQYVAGMSGVPKLLDFGDMDSQKWLIYAGQRGFPLSAGYAIEGRKLEHAEKRLARRFDLCTCTTREELDTLNAYATGVDTDWFPNGVDAEYFCPADEPYDANTICFVGRMDYYPNQQAVQRFCDEALPRIRARRPEVSLLVVGAEPSAAIRKLSERPNVTVTGSVDDVRPYVRGAALTVAPLEIARGTQNKILESMAMGVPVVASAVAGRGVDAVPGEHLLTGSNAEEYADGALRVLESADLRDSLSRAGRARVLSHHDWAQSMVKMESLLERCIENAARRGATSRESATSAVD